MQNESEWNLIEQGKFAAACERADEVYAETQSELPLRNKVSALLLLGSFEGAAELCEFIIDRTQGRSEHDFARRGIALWLLKDRMKAVEVWRDALSKRRRTDAAGGMQVPMLLHYASLKTNDPDLAREAENRIAYLLRSPQANSWPGPMGLFIAGRMSETELRSIVDNNINIKRRQLCKISFWVGFRMREEDPDRFVNSIQESLSYVPEGYLENEYYLALGERKR